jgi:phage FluMu protein Com
MNKPRSPIDAMIDAACGVTETPTGGSDRRFVQLRCPRCKRSKRVRRDPSDPPNCATLEFACPKCNPTNDEMVDYYDADGDQINVDGDKLNNIYSYDLER